MSEKKKDSLDSIIDNTFDHIKNIVDANTVVGKKIELGNGVFVIPVSKISVGLVSGGGTLAKPKNAVNAGSGTGFNIIPVGFITIANNAFNFLSVTSEIDIGKNIIENLINIVGNYFESNKNVGADDE